MAWLIGALFIPAAALALGVWSGSGKPFEILFTLFWYVGPLHAMPPPGFHGLGANNSDHALPAGVSGSDSAPLSSPRLAGRKRQLHS